MDRLDNYVGKANLKVGAMVGRNQKLGRDIIEEGDGGLMEVEEEGGGLGEGGRGGRGGHGFYERKPNHKKMGATEVRFTKVN